MAKAYATCTCATCGRTFEATTIKRNSTEAKSWEMWAEEHIDECPDCREKRLAQARAEENQKNAEEAVENGYPTLEGTPKQVAWANTIRNEFLAKLPEDKLNDEQRQVRAYIIATYTKASFWIDNRIAHSAILRQAVSEYKAKAEELEAKAETETITAPQEQKHSGVVEITAAIDKVTASYERNDDFRALVKGLGYRWNGEEWEKKIKATTGTSAERAAELGNKLLNGGFAIRIADPDVRRAAVEGTYEPETHRWITLDAGNLLRITWGEDDDLYRAARAIKKSKYDRPGVVVPITEYASILDFAETYDFKISPKAASAINAYKASIEVVAPAPPLNPEYQEKNVADILNSDRAILPDLKDDVP